MRPRIEAATAMGLLDEDDCAPPMALRSTRMPDGISLRLSWDGEPHPLVGDLASELDSWGIDTRRPFTVRLDPSIGELLVSQEPT